MAYRSDKKIIAELLLMYKDLPCLWDVTNQFYSNKVARNRAYNTLVEKYKELDSDCNHITVKKKIENMRTTYKRERYKVIQSQYRSDEEIYKPSLWYYSLLTFLDQLEQPTSDETHQNETSNIETSEKHETKMANESILLEESGLEEIVTVEPVPESDLESEAEESRPVKRPKPMSIYIKSENDYNYESEMPRKSFSKKAKKNKSKSYSIEDDEVLSSHLHNEASLESTSQNDLFGRTISAQLSDLRPKQRFIAQKLISDVIFYGRLDKLRTESRLQLRLDHDNNI